MWLIMRPKPKLNASVAAFQQHGFSAIGIATIDIQTNPTSIKALQQALNHSNPTSLASLIVTSTEAAKQLKTIWPAEHRARCICIGNSSKQVLSKLSLEFVVPEEESSEGLLRLEQLKAVNGQHYVLIKGEGGRDLIAKTLEERGATVDIFAVYKRVKLSPFYTTAAINWDEIYGITVTSQSQALALLDVIPPKQLQDKAWLCASDRIRTFLLSYGIEEIHVTDGASDEHLLGWMKTQWRGSK